MDHAQDQTVSPTCEASIAEPRLVGMQLFALSFASLFLELMLIRWVPAVVRLVAYYANLMLISSFLGLGVGALLARRKWRLFGWFPALLVVHILILLACADRLVFATTSEARFFTEERPSQLKIYLILVAVFVFNTGLFVPLGQRIGQLFHALPPLRAYSWDLGGSLCGTLVFGAFSILYFSPIIGVSLVAVIYLLLAEKRGRVAGVLLLPVAVAGVVLGTDYRGIWSPYHFISVAKMVPGFPSAGAPEPDLRTMHDPPLYWMRVGRDFYQQHGTLDLARYSPGAVRDWVTRLHNQYLLPYQVPIAPKKVVILGAGGGMDVQAALMSGVQHVDAVELDRVLVDLSRKYNSAGVYYDPRVKVHITDGRAFLRRMDSDYDMVIFSFLDSQALFSSMTNLRMDSYIYTVQSIRTAWSKLAPNGVLALSFGSPAIWLAPKLKQTIVEATGTEPITFVTSGAAVFCVPKGDHKPPPDTFGHFSRIDMQFEKLELPTDDWPYLYLKLRTIPNDYLIVIASLLAISIAAVASARGTSVGPGDAHFFLLGLGFLLLQTKSITDCSLYFGTTWLVTTIVIAGVLLMVLLANLIAIRLRRFAFWFYVPLLASLVALYLTPRDWVLAQPLAGRLAWSLLMVPLPVFFAGLVFSTTFRSTLNPSVAFGTNLIGATVGGFCEYLGMAVGSNALSLIVIGAYIASLICQVLGSRRAVDIAPASS